MLVERREVSTAVKHVAIHKTISPIPSGGGKSRVRLGSTIKPYPLILVREAPGSVTVSDWSIK